MEKTATKKEFTVMELAYISKFYDHDGATNISLAVNRSSQTVRSMVNKLKNEGSLEKYQKIWDMQFDRG